MAPAADSPFNIANVNKGMNRMSFNVPNFAKEAGVGPLVAGNYMLVQNMTGMSTASTGGTPSASVTGPAMMPSETTFIGEAAKTDLHHVADSVLAACVGTALLLL